MCDRVRLRRGWCGGRGRCPARGVGDACTVAPPVRQIRTSWAVPAAPPPPGAPIRLIHVPIPAAMLSVALLRLRPPVHECHLILNLFFHRQRTTFFCLSGIRILFSGAEPGELFQFEHDVTAFITEGGLFVSSVASSLVSVISVRQFVMPEHTAGVAHTSPCIPEPRVCVGIYVKPLQAFCTCGMEGAKQREHGAHRITERLHSLTCCSQLQAALGLQQSIMRVRQ